MIAAAGFWSKTILGPGGCIDWTACRDQDGYGKYSIRRDGATKTYRAHRWIYAQAFGGVPALLMHTCDRPQCVALQHLSPGTHLLNHRDAIAKDRDARGERHIHARLSEENVREIRERRWGGESIKAIASDFRISYTMARSACIGRTWKHVGTPPARNLGTKCGPLAAILLRQMKRRGARSRDLEHAFGLKRCAVNDIARGACQAQALVALIALITEATRR